MKSGLRLAQPPPGRKRRRSLKGLLLLFLLLGAGVLLFKAGESFCRVEEIAVTGAVRLSEAEVISLSGIKKGTSLLLLHGAGVERRLASLPPVRSVTVRKHLPATVGIAVQEREEAASLLDQQRFWLIDAEGILFAEQPHPAEGLPVITGAEPAEIVMGRPLGRADKSAALGFFLEAMLQVPLLEPAELNLSDPGDLVLYTAEGCRVLLGDSEKMIEKLVLLQAFLQEGGRGGCLDLRTGDRLVVVSGKEGE